MRLLKLLPNGDFHLTKKFLEDAIPRFEDMEGDSGRDKVQDKGGYKKIQFCGD
jgi:hypothetical protein